MAPKSCLVFGAHGAIGTAVALEFERKEFQVWRSSRSHKPDIARGLVATGESKADARTMQALPEFDAVVWAQGSNLNDSISEFKAENLDELLNSNVKFVASTLATLISQNKIVSGAKMCIVSSVWQDAIRPNKLSYAVSKAALNGLLKSVALDLSERKIFVNAVLPGVIDTSMTRGVLSDEQILAVQGRTGFGRLVQPEELAEVIYFLCSESNNCISGQSIVADLGFTNVRPV
jgi:NAD(P)-dependent dehydrogenase (short-subunit alcohol dehydrogenase family)